MTRAAFLALAAGLAAPKSKREKLEVCTAAVDCVPFTVTVAGKHKLLVTLDKNGWHVSSI